MELFDHFFPVGDDLAFLPSDFWIARRPMTCSRPMLFRQFWLLVSSLDFGYRQQASLIDGEATQEPTNRPAGTGWAL